MYVVNYRSATVLQTVAVSATTTESIWAEMCCVDRLAVFCWLSPMPRLLQLSSAVSYCMYSNDSMTYFRCTRCHFQMLHFTNLDFLPTRCTYCHLTNSVSALMWPTYLHKNFNSKDTRVVVTSCSLCDWCSFFGGWPLTWKTWKIRGIWLFSGKSHGN